MTNTKNLKDLNAYKDYDYSPIFCHACIGNNSGVSAENRDMFAIFKGFYDAENIIFNHIYNGSLTIDTAVYPFMFCCRHALELILKTCVKNILHLKAIKEKHYDEKCCKEYYKLLVSKCPELTNHDLKKLLDYIKDKFDIDKRLVDKYDSSLTDLYKLLDEFFIDVKSDTFRYTYDLDNRENLSGEVLIMVDIIYDKLEAAFDILNNINSDIVNLINEYKIGTFTKNLSRKDIEDISKLLPKKDDWINDSFKELKLEILKKYNVSVSELCKAINIIKTHREFCSNIGMEIKFRNLSEDTLKKTAFLIKVLNKHNDEKFKESKKLYSISDIYNPDENRFFDKVIDICRTIPAEEICILNSFITISEKYYYSEELDSEYERFKKLYLANIDYDYIISHCFEGKYIKLIKGLKKCGQVSYLKILEDNYNSLVKEGTH